MITTEGLLTGHEGFRIAGATPVQRAGARVVDGRRLRELREHPDVIAAFGGLEAIDALPSERGIKPTEFYNVASPRTAKTTLAVAAAIVATQTVDVSQLGPGELPRVSILSVKLDQANVPFRRLVGTIEASTVLRPLLLERGADSVLVRHPSGLPIEIAVVAGGKAAGGITARWSAGVIADEATRMNARSDDSVANLDDVLSVARERLLPGAQIQGIGSPHAPFGTMYELVQSYFGKPTDEIVVMRTTGPAGNPSHWTPERLQSIREKDENAWRIIALGEFLDPESGLLSPIAVRRATREGPLELPPEHGATYGAAADVGTDRLTLVIVEGFESDEENEDGDSLPAYRVALAHEARGGTPDARWAEMAEKCRRYGVTDVVVDQYAAAENASIAGRCGLQLDEEPWSSRSRLEAYTNLATLVHAGRVELSPDRLLRADLLGVKRRTTQSGVTIVLPTTRDGRHSDFAPALAASLRTAQAACHFSDLSLVGASLGRSGGWGAGRDRAGSNGNIWRDE